MSPENATLSSLMEQYDAFVLDQFGVLLNGDGIYPCAPQAVKRLSEAGKLILMLSNSGKRARSNEARLTDLGFDRNDYYGVLSSGEAAYKFMSERIGAEIAAGTAVFILSRDQDTSSIDGLDLVQTLDVNRAGLIILAGCPDDGLELGHYEKLFRRAAEKGTPCICTNPDIMMLTGNGVRFGNGQIAKLYEQMGGQVEWIGKPHPLIYKMAHQILADRGAKNVICIGDSPEHDIAGGKGAGYSTALVRTGIHESDPLAHVLDLCAELNSVPDYIIPKFEF